MLKGSAINAIQIVKLDARLVSFLQACEEWQQLRFELWSCLRTSSHLHKLRSLVDY